MYDVVVLGAGEFHPCIDGNKILQAILDEAGWCGLVTAKIYLKVCPNARLLILDGDASIGST